MAGFVRANRYLIVVVIIAALTVAVYWQTLGFGLTNYDDNRYVLDNPYVPAGLTPQGVKWALTTTFECTWGPVLWISHMADTQVFGMRAGGRHLTNLLLHLMCSLLLFYVLARMTGSVWRSGFVAALFALHPLHVESVAWVAERKDVLSGLFWILAMLAYVRYTEKPSLKGYALVALAFALGLMAKPMLVTLPLALLLLDYWPLGRLRTDGGEPRRSVWGLVREKIPLFAIAVASSVAAYIVQSRGGSVSDISRIPMGERLANAVVSYVVYLRQTVWPVNLAAIYPHPGASLPKALVVMSGMFLAFATIAILREARRRPYLLVGWLWFLLTLVPVIGLIPIGEQAMADRYTYLPLIGVFVMIAWGVRDALPSKRFRWVIAASAMVALGALTVRSHEQTGYWRDSVTLFEHALACTSGNYVAHNQLGAALNEAARRGEADMEDAISHFQASMRINPRYVAAQGNLGIALLESGRAREAIPILLQMTRNFPQDVRAHANLAMALQQAGKTDDAIREFREAVRIAPDNMAARSGLGNMFLSQGKTDDAIAEYLEMVKVNPKEPAAHHNLAVAFFDKKDYARAWHEVHLCEEYGGSPNPDFLDALSAKMPDPGE